MHAPLDFLRRIPAPSGDTVAKQTANQYIAEEVESALAVLGVEHHCEPQQVHVLAVVDPAQISEREQLSVLVLKLHPGALIGQGLIWPQHDRANVVGQLGGEFRASTNFLVGAADAYAGAESVGSQWEPGRLAELGCQPVLLEEVLVCLLIVWKTGAIV